MKPRIEFKLWKKKLCPSGYWDNGLYYLSNETVSFPKSIFDTAIVVEVMLEIEEHMSNKKRLIKAYKVVYEGSTWIIDRNPLKSFS